MQKVQLSILMSVYNGEKTLDKAIESIISQTYSDFEFVICDDCSTDGSWEIMCGWAERDSRIRLVRNMENLGLAASLNHCLSIASGDYIARQDADDISDITRIEKTMNYLTAGSLPYAGCGVYVFDDGGVWSKRLFPEVITKHVIAQKNPFFHPTMVFRREVMERVGGYRVCAETLRTEDYDLVMRLAREGIIGQNLQEYLYYVYEPEEAYARHTLKTRWREIKVRLYGLKAMNAPARDYIYLARPVIMFLVPRKLKKIVKRLQWGVEAERNKK